MVTWLALLGAALLCVGHAAASPLPAAGEPPPTRDDAAAAAATSVSERPRRSPPPAADAPEEASSQWRPQSVSKPQFVTKRGPEAYDAASPRFNEIPLPERNPVAYSTRLQQPYRDASYRDSNYRDAPYRDGTYRDAPYRDGSYRDGAYYNPGSVRPRPSAQRRIIYYADLPDGPRPRARAYSDPRAYSGRDPYGPSGSSQVKYNGRYDDRPTYGPYNRDDWYRYRSAAPPPPNPGSYAIIDAERVPPTRQGYGARPYPDPDPGPRYQRVPAPYQRNAGQQTPLAPATYSYDDRRQPTAPARFTVGSNRYSEPYRDYNPHQAAPWSMQIGTKLTVKDENRDKQYGPGRRFYVQSQEQGPYRASPTRYDRVEDDPRHRL